MKKYEVYKESGADWLGEIPTHWSCFRMKNLFKDVSIKNKPGSELLSVTQDKGVIPRSEVGNRMVMPSGTLESFKFIKKGDFAISLRSFEGGLEYCHHDGIISPAYTVLKSKNKIENNYYKYLFKSPLFISELQTAVVGIREGKNISFSELSYSLLPIPILTEQTAIANFLDNKTTKIDQAITIKKRQIELLKERRQILIQNAVTGKLNLQRNQTRSSSEADIRPSSGAEMRSSSGAEMSEVDMRSSSGAEMKDSGIDWIGQIPQNWEVKKLKFFVKESFSGGTPSTEKEEFWNGSVPWVSSADVKNFHLHTTIRNISKKGLKRSSSKIAPKESLIIVTRSGILQHTLPISILQKDMAINQDIKCFRFGKSLLPNFFMHFVRGNNNELLQYTRQQAATVESINLDQLLNLLIPIPPISEQQKIIKNICKIDTSVATILDLKEQEIGKLKEYKSTLINAAVTGKIKVT